MTQSDGPASSLEESRPSGASSAVTALAASLAGVRKRIEEACQRSDRDPATVRLVAVTKAKAASVVRDAIAAGMQCFGENRVQEASDKIKELSIDSGSVGVEWHMIGHLQSNKARRAVELFGTIHSVDSLRLAERLNQAAADLDVEPAVLIQVNLGNEETKSGVQPQETLALARQIAGLPNLNLRGLMAVPPYKDSLEEIRAYFRTLRLLRDEVLHSGAADSSFKELSMGMSHDFEVAIEEGATMVRVGTALFGRRA
jgi:pyridoxal phosphate enzyme (YggS family)